MSYIYITVNPKGGKDGNLKYIVEAFEDEQKAKDSIKEYPHCYVTSVWLHKEELRQNIQDFLDYCFDIDSSTMWWYTARLDEWIKAKTKK